MSQPLDLESLAARVDLLAIQLEDLTLAFNNFRVSAAQHQRGGGYPDHNSPTASVPSSAATVESTSATYNRLAEEIPEVSLEAVELCSRLSGGSLSQRQRAARAWESGWWARFCLANRLSKPRPSRPIDLGNSVYVVLRAEGHTCPKLLNRASDYRAIVGQFTENTISHGFPSLAEARVYCSAAGVTCPTSFA